MPLVVAYAAPGTTGELDYMVWIDPDGAQVILHAPVLGYTDETGGTTLVRSREGMGRPPVEHVSDVTPGVPGATPRAAITGVREVDLAMHVGQASVAALRQRIRDLARRFDAARDGRLRVTSGDGSVRDLICRYAGGLPLEESVEQGGRIWQQFVLELKAFDPYWYDVDPVVHTFAVPVPTPWFPILPLVLSASTVVDALAVTNSGEVAAWPVWTLTGPCRAVTMTNQTSGRTLAWNGVLDEASRLVIDTRPGVKTVTAIDASGTATNRYASLAAGGRDLWPLEPGSNALAVDVLDATADSQLVLEFTPAYLTV